VTQLRQLRIPENLCQALERRFHSQFSSVDELAEFVLRELLQDETKALDESEQQMIRDRLKDLGYL